MTFDEPMSWSTVAAAFDALVTYRGPDLLRMKGILNVKDTDKPVVIHGVQHVFHPPATLDAWPEGDDRKSRVVFITRDIAESTIRKVFASFFDAEKKGWGNARRAGQGAMKLATITHGGATKAALVDADGKTFWPLEDMLGRAVPDLGAIAGELDAIKSKIKPTGTGLPLSAVKIEAPIPRPARNVMCVGKNYHEHAKEFTRSGLRQQRQLRGRCHPDRADHLHQGAGMRDRRRRRHPLPGGRQRSRWTTRRSSAWSSARAAAASRRPTPTPTSAATRSSTT